MDDANGHEQRVESTVAALREIRRLGGMVVGFGPGQCPPMWATKLEKAGLAVVTVADGVRRIAATPPA